MSSEAPRGVGRERTCAGLSAGADGGGACVSGGATDGSGVAAGGIAGGTSGVAAGDGPAGACEDSVGAPRAEASAPGSGARAPEIPHAASAKTRAVAPRNEGIQNQGRSAAREVARSRRSRRRWAAAARQESQRSCTRHRRFLGRLSSSQRMRLQAVRDAIPKSQTMAHGSQQNARDPTNRAELQRILSPHCRQRRPASLSTIRRSQGLRSLPAPTSKSALRLTISWKKSSAEKRLQARERPAPERRWNARGADARGARGGRNSSRADHVQGSQGAEKLVFVQAAQKGPDTRRHHPSCGWVPGAVRDVLNRYVAAPHPSSRWVPGGPTP